MMNDDDDDPKRFSDFAETSLIIFEKNKIFRNFRKFAKSIFIRKKIQLQLSKSGVFREKKNVPQIPLNCGHN